MPTTNLTITHLWTRLTNGSDAGFLASGQEVGWIEYAVTTSTTAPSNQLQGHVLPQNQLIGRGITGPGYVWARVVPDDHESIIAVTE